MSHEDDLDVDDGALDALFDAGRKEPVPNAFAGRRKLFHRFALGGTSALTFVRATQAFAALPGAARGGLAILAVGTAVLFASSLVHRSPAPDVVVNAPAIGETPAPLASENTTSPSVETPVPVFSVDSLPTVTAPPPRPRAESPDESLARETRSIAAIRKLVASSEWAGALTAVGRHRQAFPNGVLDQEATVLEIEALQGAHDPRGCKSGRAFLETHPASAYRTRVTSLLRACE
ncbi:hypothetical protein AKJ09_06506 [Labilithrix luteola]|uniref:Uncharacterized protein n=1 Tax=Labilithrix luteola TaxID=1391654 RepID=A0A0K1Q283_9BACT|nr:hypothetical protein [Labilithrix luteola]AKU99842.1 hypothetical protein AKJ09_06506 [Labilithrix luteola]